MANGDEQNSVDDNEVFGNQGQAVPDSEVFGTQEGIVDDSVVFGSGGQGVSDTDVFGTQEQSPPQQQREFSSTDFSEEAIGDPWTRGIKNALFAAANFGEMVADWRIGLREKYKEVLPDIVAEGLVPDSRIIDEATKALRRYAAGINARPSQLPKPERWQEYFTEGLLLEPNRAYQVLAEGLPLTGALMATAVANPVAGTALMAGVEGGDAYANIKEFEERTGEEVPLAQKIATPIIVGSINAALERTGIEKILGATGAGQGVKRKLINIGIASMVESGTEGAQLITQELGKLGYTGEIPEDIGTRLIEDMYSGLVIGGGLSSVNAVMGEIAMPSPDDASFDGFQEVEGDLQPQFRIQKPGHELEGEVVGLEEIEAMEDVQTPAWRRDRMKKQMIDTGFAESELQAETGMKIVDAMAANRGMNTEEFIDQYIDAVVDGRRIEKGDLLQTLNLGVTENGTEVTETVGNIPEAGSIVPTVVDANGRMYIGSLGDNHASVVDKYNIEINEETGLGFTNESGLYLSRQDAAQVVQSRHPLVSSEYINQLENQADKALDPDTRMPLSKRDEVGDIPQDDFTQTLQQMRETTAKAAVSFNAGKATLKAFQQADISSFAHEMAHVYRRTASGSELIELSDLFEVEDGKWTRDKEEQFARAFEKYLATGKSDNKTAQLVLNRFRNWLIDIYSRITGSDIDVDITDDQRQFFADMLESLNDEISQMKEPQRSNALARWYNRILDGLDIERGFRRAGFGELGFHIKNFFSIQSVYVDEGYQVVQKFMQSAGFDRSTALQAILAAESVEQMQQLEQEGGPVYEAAKLLRDYFDNSLSQYLAAGGLEMGFKERMLGQLEGRMQQAEEKSEAEAYQELMNQIREAEDIEYVHIPYVHWFRTISQEDPKRALELKKKVLSLMVDRQRETPRLRDLIENDIVKPEEIKIEDIITSYARQKGKDFAMLNVLNAAKQTGAAIPLMKGEGFQVGYSQPPTDAPVFKGYQLHNTLKAWIQTQTRHNDLNIIQRWFNLTKMWAFWNPFFLGMYDVLQASMAGAMSVLRPVQSLKNVNKAFRDVVELSEDYFLAEENGLSSKPYNSPLEDIGAALSRAARTRTPEDASLIRKLGGQGKSYVEYALLDIYEKAFRGTVFDFAKQLGGARPLLRNIYQSSWDVAWMLDRVVRQSTYNEFINRGYSPRDAAQQAAQIHADYASVSPSMRRRLNSFLFTPTFKIAMGKWMIDSIRSIGSVLNRSATLSQKQKAGVFIRTLGILTAFDMMMLAFDFDRDQFGRRYTKEISTDTGKRELVINWTGPHNLFLKYLQRTNEAFGPEVPNVMIRLFNQNSWEFHPLLRVMQAITRNETPGGEKIYFVGDDPYLKVAKSLEYASLSLITLIQQLAGEQEFGQEGAEAFAREYGQALEVITSPFLFKYTRQTAPVRFQNKLRMLMSIHEEEVQADLLLHEIVSRNRDPQEVIQEYINGKGVFSSTARERSENLVRRMRELITEYEEQYYERPTGPLIQDQGEVVSDEAVFGSSPGD